MCEMLLYLEEARTHMYTHTHRNQFRTIAMALETMQSEDGGIMKGVHLIVLLFHHATEVGLPRMQQLFRTIAIRVGCHVQNLLNA